MTASGGGDGRGDIMDSLHWTFILTALTLIFVVGAVNPLQAATEEAVENNARLQAMQVASSINLMSTAPDKTTYIIDTPDSRCTIRISKGVVYLEIRSLDGKTLSEAVSIIETGLDFEEKEFQCRQTPSLRLTKDKGTLRIEGV